MHGEITNYTLRTFIENLRTLPLGMYDTLRELAITDGVPAALAAMRRRYRAAVALGLDASLLDSTYLVAYRAWSFPETD